MKWEINTWKLVKTKLGNVDIFISISADFDLKRGWGKYYRAINNSPILGNQVESMGRNHHSHKCPIIEKYGNIEVGIKRMGGEMGHEQ